MKQLFLLSLYLLTLSALPAQNAVSYTYDNAGNRISRKIVPLSSNPTNAKAQEPAPVEEQMGERKIRIYPNPTKGALAVEITGGDEKDQLRLILFNADGRQLLNKQM